MRLSLGVVSATPIIIPEVRAGIKFEADIGDDGFSCVLRKSVNNCFVDRNSPHGVPT